MTRLLTDRPRVRALMGEGTSRWRVAGVVLLLILLFDAAAVFVHLMPTTYTAESVVAIRPVEAAETPTEDLKLIANELVVYLSNQSIQDEVTADGADASFSVRNDPDTATVRIAATTSDPDHSVAAADKLAGLAGAKTTERATTETLSKASDNPLAEGPPRLMYLAGGLVVVAGLGITALMIRRPGA